MPLLGAPRVCSLAREILPRASTLEAPDRRTRPTEALYARHVHSCIDACSGFGLEVLILVICRKLLSSSAPGRRTCPFSLASSLSKLPHPNDVRAAFRVLFVGDFFVFTSGLVTSLRHSLKSLRERERERGVPVRGLSGTGNGNGNKGGSPAQRPPEACGAAANFLNTLT